MFFCWTDDKLLLSTTAMMTMMIFYNNINYVMMINVMISPEIQEIIKNNNRELELVVGSEHYIYKNNSIHQQAMCETAICDIRERGAHVPIFITD